MHAPGVDVRPLRQMTGEAEFNEVYFTEVRIPDADRLGEVGKGWGVALDHPDERAGLARRGLDAERGGPIAIAVDYGKNWPPTGQGRR